MVSRTFGDDQMPTPEAWPSLAGVLWMEGYIASTAQGRLTALRFRGAITASPPQPGQPRGRAARQRVRIGSEDRNGSGRPGNDLLSRRLSGSTIGPGGLNDRVRNGIGWGTSGIVTRPAGPVRFVRSDIVCHGTA